jgi:broad specificity phosphatase PhoE
MAKIMVIRHAEKPNGEPGVMPDGTENPEALTATGWKRAEALVGLFDPPDGSFAPHLARPERLFASGSNSLRPRQTLAPLSEALKLAIDATFLKGQESRLVAAAKSAGGVVLIAWQHEAIPEIASLIRGSPAGIPATWPGRRYDMVWVFDSEGGDIWSFSQTPELVLPGDSPAPIG